MTDVRRTRLELLLKVLDVDGAVQRVQGGWTATGRGWVHDTERYARVAATREAEAAAMLAYEATTGCRMRFLAEALDDPAAADCGRCDRCAGPWYPTDVPDSARAAAGASLSRVGVELAPRAQWPSGMDRLGVPVKGRIPADEQVGAGRAVARLTDLGWGTRLRALLAEGAPDAPADAALLAACVDVLKTWGWERRPVAVATVPSRSRPLLVASVGEHLATLGRLAWLGPLEPAGEGPGGGRGATAPSGSPASGTRSPPAPSSCGLCLGSAGRTARGRPRRLPVDRHGRRAGPAPGRRPRRSAVRAGGDGVRAVSA